MSLIQAIDKNSVHRITSGQVVVDLQTAVKELLENSIDAGATSIEIRFKDFGLKQIEVIDNGSGISPNDYSTIALKSYTSKLSTFEDLSRVHSFGFRGEALASLCAISESVAITTATTSEAPVGTVLEFDRNGAVSTDRRKVARQPGTTVLVTGLFVPLPVRRTELARNIKREFARLLNLLNAYALYPCATAKDGTRLTVSNILENGKKTIQLRTPGTPGITNAVSAIWGPKSNQHLVAIRLEFEVEPEKSHLKRLSDAPSVSIVVDGLVSQFVHGRGRSSNDRQFFFVNGRPCALPKIQKAMNEVYKTYNALQFPFIVANLVLPTNAYDINITPDKRTIFLHNEANVIQALKTALDNQFSSSRSTFALNNVLPSSEDPSSPSHREAKQVKEDSLPDASASKSDLDHQVIEVEDRSGTTPSGILRSKMQLLADANEISSVRLETVRDSQSARSAVIAQDRQLSPISFTSSPLDSTSPCASFEPHVEEESPEGVAVPRSVDADDLANVSRTTYAAAKRKLSLSPGVDLPPTIFRPPAPSLGSDTPSYETHVSSNKRARVFSLRSSVSLRSSPPPSACPIPGATPDLLPPVTEPLGLSTPQETNIGGDLKSGLRLSKQRLLNQSFNRGEAVSVLHGHSLPAPKAVNPSLDEDGESDQDEDNMDMDPNSVPSNPPTPHEEHSGPFERTVGVMIAAEVDTSSNLPPLHDNEADAARPEIIRSANIREIAMPFDSVCVSSKWASFRMKPKSFSDESPDLMIMREAPTATSMDLVDAGISSTADEVVAKALSRVISKDDFSPTGMQVIGQFNLGFIIARLNHASSLSLRSSQPSQASIEDRRASVADDLFIIDQHAADEKYNFETLQQTTRIQCQSLLRPRALELPASDEVVAAENLDVLRANGFEVSFEEDAPIGRRMHLVAQPQSKSTVFDMHDLEELLSLLHDHPPGQMVRTSKARSMFASRACRKSVMIGKPLSSAQMTSIIRQMATLDQPWACPHGRPTMRHLLDLTQNYRQQTVLAVGAANWTEFKRTMCSLY